MEDFSDKRVFVVAPGDARLGVIWDERGGYEQAWDSPIFVVIGRETSDDKCAQLASRFGLAATDLLAFRESRRNRGSVTPAELCRAA